MTNPHEHALVFNPEYQLLMADHNGSIELLDEAPVLLDFNTIPKGGGFSIVERNDLSPNGLNTLHFYRNLPSEVEGAPEWYVIGGDQEPTLYPVILHGSASPNGQTHTRDVREGMQFYYQEIVAFRSQEDAPPVDRFTRPEGFEEQDMPIPRPEDLPVDKLLDLHSRGIVIVREDNELYWQLPGEVFPTGYVQAAD